MQKWLHGIEVDFGREMWEEKKNKQKNNQTFHYYKVYKNN